MAIQNWSTTNYLSIGSSLVTAYPFTLSCWFNSNSATANQNMIVVKVSGTDARVVGINAAGNVGGDPVQMYVSDTSGGNFVTTSTTTGYTTNTWHHACAVFASATSRTVYIDGGSSASSSTSRTVSAYNLTSIGAYLNPGAGNAFSGLLAEVCIHTADLSANEVASLAKGVSPLLVRPQSLVHYLPMIRTAAQDLKGTTWTTTGAPNAHGTHPRMYYPADMFATYRASASAFKAWLAAQVNQIAGVAYA